jgi:transporter family protein
MDAAIGLSLVVMISWGAADLFTALFTRRSTILSAFLYAQLGMVILYSIAAMIWFPLPNLSLQAAVLLIVAGALSTSGYLFFCRAMQIGPVSIASSVIGCTPIITVILTTVFLGEDINRIQIGGIALAIVGAALTSLKFEEIISLSLRKMEKAAFFGIGAFLSWGVFYALIDYLTKSIGWLYPLFLAKVASVIMFGAYLATTGKIKETAKIPSTVWLIALGVIVLEFIGHFSYGLGVFLEQSAIVNPISFSYPIVAVFLAHVVLKERLENTQYLGIALTISGIVLLAM